MTEVNPGDVVPVQVMPAQPPHNLSEWGWRLLAYAMDKGPVFFVLVLILVAIGWGGHHALTKAIPEHLSTIQKGYSEQSNTFREVLKEDRVERKEQFKEMRDSFDRGTEEFGRATKEFSRVADVIKEKK